MKTKSSKILKNVCLIDEGFIVPIKAQIEGSDCNALPEVDDKKEESVNKQELIDQAISEIEKLKQEAKKDGFELGYKEGLEKVREDFETKDKERLEIFKEQIAKLKNENKESILKIEKRLEEEAFNIVIKSINKILHSNFLKKEDILKERINAFLREIPPNIEIKLKVSKDDANKFNDFDIPVEVDPMIKSGDFVIKTDFGFLDGRIKSIEDDFINELQRIFE
jgi:flagellar assembly protein FliH